MVELFKMFPNDEAARLWFENNIWPNGPACPHCGCTEYRGTTHPTMPYRCRACRKFYSVRMGTVMERTHISYQNWAIATYQFMTNVKGISSMKLHRDLHITQRSAWFMVHRLRESWRTLAGPDNMTGPVEIDETYVGGTESNKHADKKGKRPKVAVAGIRDRKTGMVAAAPVPEVTQARMEHFIERYVESMHTTTKYTDGNTVYHDLKRHRTVNHSAGEYVRGRVHTNGIESFWALLQRGYVGIFHWFSEKHMHRYVNEFAGRLNIRDYDTIEMMCMLAKGMVGRRLTYAALTA